MPNPLETLASIQKIDIEIKTIESESDLYRQKISTLQDSLSDKEGTKDTSSGELDELNDKKKELDEIVRVAKEKIDKDEQRIGEIQNDKEFKALTKEISNAKQTIKLTGMELESISEKIDGKEGEVSDSDGALDSTKSEIETLTQELEENSKEWATVLSTKNSEREGLIANIAAPVLNRYDAVRSKRAGIGIVNVVKEICQGCFINIPPQTFIQLQKSTNEEILECPHCHRLIYFEKEEEKEEE